MVQDATLSLSEPPAAHRLRVRATYASLAVAAVLIAAKLVVWISTDSVALLSSLVDSFVDAAASLVNFFAVRQAIVPADREHRFGHGKAEPLAALGQSAFLIGSAVGLWIIYGAVRIARLSLVQLMDREMPDTERARVRAIAEGHPEVTAVHDIRTRIAGPTTFIQLHIEMDGGMNLLRAHEISDAVEAQIQAAFPQAEV